MKVRGRVAAAAAVAAAGAALMLWAAAGSEADVAQVAEVVAEPDGFLGKRAMLIGVPQPAEVPVTGERGVELVPNPAWSPTTSRAGAWRWADGTLMHSVHQVTLDSYADGRATFTVRNDTRPAGAVESEATTSRFTVEGYRPVPVQGFGAHPPAIWALVRESQVKEAMQPKPSQFEGTLLTALPDGTPVPDGALLWLVQEYTAGCSSKFLPPEERGRV